MTQESSSRKTETVGVSEQAALRIRDLRVSIGRGDAAQHILKGIDLDLRAGKIQGLAGESGSGKTVTALAVLGLLARNISVSGQILLGETNLVGMRTRELNDVRGRRIAMVFQDPSASLHPQLTVGHQLTDHVRRHLRLDKRAAAAHAVELLNRVRVPSPQEALGKYPHQFSGGQLQRVAIAVALACDPEVLLADEPTTALDVTVQAGILHLIRDLVDEENLAVLLVTHDLGVMSAVADDVAVMRYGEVVEAGSRHDVFTSPQHDYTKTLLESLPSAQAALDGSTPIIDPTGTTPGDDLDETERE